MFRNLGAANGVLKNTRVNVLSIWAWVWVEHIGPINAWFIDVIVFIWGCVYNYNALFHYINFSTLSQPTRLINSFTNYPKLATRRDVSSFPELKRVRAISWTASPGWTRLSGLAQRFWPLRAARWTPDGCCYDIPKVERRTCRQKRIHLLSGFELRSGILDIVA